MGLQKNLCMKESRSVKSILLKPILERFSIQKGPRLLTSVSESNFKVFTLFSGSRLRTVHQRGTPILGSVNLVENFRQISNTSTNDFFKFSTVTAHFPDFFHCMVFDLEYSFLKYLVSHCIWQRTLSWYCCGQN